MTTSSSQEFAALLPRLRTHAQIVFRDLRCRDSREDKVAECVALAWQWYARLIERGKDISQFTMVFVFLVAKAVRSGRRLCGQEPAKDVMSPLAQRRHRFRLSQETDRGTGNPLEEALTDNTVSPPDEQAAFRIDFGAWRAGFSERDRRIIDDLMIGERTSEVSHKYGISQGRVSQKRRAFHEAWLRFHGEEGPAHC